jgi:hypothetical protein
VAGRDEAYSVEQEADRTDDEPTNAGGTECPWQPIKNDDLTNQQKETREIDVPSAHMGNPSWESTQSEETGRGEDTQISPKR